jgi:pimeloyl-ACP methyl ester carboxylesterase
MSRTGFGRRSAFALWPGSDSGVSVRTTLQEAAAFTRDSLKPEDFPETAARGRGRPVVVLPGFFSPDVGTARLRAFLARQDFAVYPWGQGINIGPTKTILSGLEKELERLYAAHGRPLALIGQSLGGTIAREAAKRRPDLVDYVITIVAPIRVPVITTLAPLADVMAHVWDHEARSTLHQISAPPPMRLTAIVAPRDGLVDYRSCMPDPGPNVEVIMVDGTHTTMGSNPTVQRIVAEKLSSA